MFVSVSAYDDADLLDACLHSVRDVLGDVPIQVVDGRYETWPDGADNSTDSTPAVAADWNAEYIAGGPYDRERSKHVDRVERAPDGERMLLLDADERLLDVDADELEAPVAYQPRIYNAAVYGPKSVYWPRSFYPGTVKAINRWDAYLFEAPCRKTDAITIVHRHDLRDRDYREAKYERFQNEGRTGRYSDRFDEYLADDWNLDPTTCPECGRQSVTRSQITDFGDEFTYVEACIAADGCYATVETVNSPETQYLPNDWRAGLDENPRQLRLELMAAGCGFVRPHPADELADRMRPAIEFWISRNLEDAADVPA